MSTWIYIVDSDSIFLRGTNMPTYVYTCPSCNHQTQISHKMNEHVPTICPNCIKTDMTKGVGGGIGIHFKGSGFYETDYKGK